MSLRFLPALVAAVVLASAGGKDVQTTPRTAVAASAAPQTTRFVAGEITYVDPALRIVAVRETVASAPQKGQKPARRTVTLALTPDTKLLRGKAPVSADELRVKDYVVVRYAETPQAAVALTLRAADVVVRSAPAPAASPSATEAAAGEFGQHR
ncbi:MAG TPA: hypothetical protein PLB02_04605 [Thermoanaerobaculia bacterium]|nr:hypothetical protein [Thermoanaerobaculia bacterium]HQR66653.1 hypothetical protein [Thermoanaerobaculia bacterium]